MLPYFKSEFKRQGNPSGKYMYWFDTLYTQTDSTLNEKYSLAVDGVVFEPDQQLTREEYLKLPEELHNPATSRNVYMKWIADCSGAFVKCPTIEQCLARTSSLVDPNATLPTIHSEEEEQSWTLQWFPTRIKVDTPVFEIYWSPCYKIPCKSRILIEEEPEPEPEKGNSVELQNPERTYTILPQVSRPNENNWIQEMADLHVPFVDSSTLRLDADEEVLKERLRRKVREARIRAKLARYRAERMAAKYEERFGIYPEEDGDEAQTDGETDNELV
jgi:hypothetical protein